MLRLCVILFCWGIRLSAGYSQEPARAPRGVTTITEIQEQITRELEQQLAAVPPILDEAPDAVKAYSRRGDLRMFLARYAEAVSDYRQMVALDPESDRSHWRLGIALFFAEDHAAAAAQFDKYHSFDDVDRENGIWRYLSHYRAFGADRARAELLRYEKDDRPPFPHVYRLFDGTLTPAAVLLAVKPELPESQRQPRLFYSHLYIGMHHVVQGRTDDGISELRLAVENPWPRTAGYGPDYMWHVGRLQHFQLLRGRPAGSPPPSPEKH